MSTILNKISIQWTTRSQNHPIAILQSLKQLIFSVMSPPHNQRLFRRNSCIYNLIPTNHRFPFRSDHIGYPTNEIMLQLHFISQLLIFNKLLNFRICIPALIAEMHFISSNMYIRWREQSNQLIQYVTDKLKGFFLTRMESKMLPLSFTTTRYVWIRTTYRRCMPWHIKFRNNHNVTFGRIGYNFSNILLPIISSRSFGIMPVANSSFSS